MSSLFSDVEMAPPIEVFALTAEYNQEKHPNKVNLGVGAYRSDEGKPWVLPVVRTVEAQMASDSTLNHEYLSVAGLADYSKEANKLLLGADSPAITQTRVLGVQSLGGTGAIKLCAEFCHRILGCNKALISDPTWGNHNSIFKFAGYTVNKYRYWSAEQRCLNFEGMMEDLNNAAEKTVVVLHGCAHNPTGVDPTEEQWAKIADVCEAKKLIVLVDIAYQGFATGNLDADGWVPRYFEKRGFEFFCAQSFSKNFGLYNERVGNLVVVTNNKENIPKIKSQMEIIVRVTWSNPPNHGARIVCTVLTNPAYYAEWKDHVKKMADRILSMRSMLYQKLVALGTPGSWNHIETQRGMFTYTGLTEPQVSQLKSKYKIFMLKSGRINMCGLTTENVDYVANAINSVVSEFAANEQSKI